jgi:Fe-S cluster assembly protein SufD
MTTMMHDNDFLARARAFAAERAAELPIPEPKYGLGIFFTSKDVGIDALPATAEERSVKIDIAAKKGNVTALPFTEAIKDPQLAAAISARLHPSMLVDAFEAWRAANAEGTVIHVPDGAEADIALMLPSAATSADHVLIAVGEHARITVTEETAAGNVGGTRVGQTDIIVLDDADVRFVSLSDRSAESREMVRRFASVGKRARMTWVNATTGGGYVQQHVRTALVGDEGKVVHRDAFFTDGDRRTDLRQVVIHSANGTASDIVTRGAGAGRSKTVTRGVIAMEKGMRRLNGRQKADLLMLSPTAEIDAMPDLEIDTADVVCGHSASVGRPDDAKLFYLRARGIPREDALRMTVEGHFAPILNATDGAIRERIAAALAARIDTLITTI